MTAYLKCIFSDVAQQNRTLHTYCAVKKKKSKQTSEVQVVSVTAHMKKMVNNL